MSAPVNCWMLRIGPPTPQPTSRTLDLSVIPARNARKYSARLILSMKVSPFTRGAKWKDYCQKRKKEDRFNVTKREMRLVRSVRSN
mmetsp:Transcript_36156/g.47834  ORF Transcript_36156/g.47834 Transcript_36156/m.47834 type:complete len:86 (+) Transcript_36156:1207-1464(+)